LSGDEALTLTAMPVEPDPRIADFVRAGTVRIGLFLPQYERKKGMLFGVGPHVVSVELARALAACMRVSAEFVDYISPPDVVDALDEEACDLGVMGQNATRVEKIAFSPTFMEFDFTYMVAAGSPIQSMSAVDQPGVHIAVAQNHAPTYALAGIVKNARLLEAPTVDDAFALLKSRKADAFASARPLLLGYSERHSGYCIFDERYGVNPTALAVAKWRPDWLAYVTEFVAQAKSSGLIQSAIDRNSLRGVRATSSQSDT
jgi:polar amino acid transport system substrate-binding protein